MPAAVTDSVPGSAGGRAVIVRPVVPKSGRSAHSSAESGPESARLRKFNGARRPTMRVSRFRNIAEFPQIAP